MKKLNKLNLTEALEGLKNNEFSSEDLVKACLLQIETYDPKIKAFITVCKDQALGQAREADKEIAQKGPKAFDEKPLLGVPYACKDNFCTKDIKTTASSKVLESFIPPYESTVTHRLKDAGAILIGKTNVDAFAHGSSTETSDFFVTKNPWHTGYVPGGSSGGSAAALASHMCIFAIGSETAGSVRGPAAWCGVTGLKPTYGRVSRYGLIAMASSTDSPGPITKIVEDTALVLQSISGKDPLDATTAHSGIEDYIGKLKTLDLKDLRGLKIGKPVSYFEIGLEKQVRDKVETAINIFEKLGAQIVEIDLINPKYSIAVYTVLQRSEVSSNLARFDGIRYGKDRSAFGFEARKRMMLGAYVLSSGYYDEYYAKAQKVRTLIVEDFATAFENVDVIIGPTMPSIPPKIGEADRSPMFGELTDLLQEPSSIAGLCGLTLPCGFSEEQESKLPVGVQVIGPQLTETKILSAGYAFQQATDFHTKFPDLEKTVKE